MEHIRAHSPQEVIWTWRFQMADTMRLVVPKGTRFLPHAEVNVEGITRLLPHAEVNVEGTVQVWGIVHSDNVDEHRVRRFHVRSTGQEFNEVVGAGYLATASVNIGHDKFVIHVFVDPDEAPIAGEGEL